MTSEFSAARGPVDRAVRPRTLRRARIFIGLAAAFVGLFLGVLPASADVVIMKDGYALYGRVVKETTVINDKEAGFFTALKPNGLTFVDDGGRWIVFSGLQRQVGEVNKEFNKYAGQELFLRKAVGSAFRQPMPKLPTIKKAETEFNKDWMRVITLHDAGGAGRYEIRQLITALTPHFMRIDSPSHFTNGAYLTREWPPSEILRLLRTHPNLVEADGKADPDKRMKIIRFMIQADWLEEAETLITEFETLFPAEKGRADKAREDIRAIRSDVLLADIERAKESARHTWARKTLQEFPKENVPAKTLARVATIQAEYDALYKQYDSAKRLLQSLIAQVKDAELRAAGKAVLDELHPDSVSRIETFVTLAEQAERDAKQGRKVQQIPEELVAAAVSGWLLGKNSAETKPPSAIKFWRAREMAIQYQRLSNPAARHELLTAFLKTPTKLEFDELAQLISLLPPAEPLKDLPQKPTPMKSGPLENLPGGVNYLLQLPPEYHPGRAFPLLILLPDGGQKPEMLLKSFGGLAARHGYIVAVLEWNLGFQNTFDFHAPESHYMTVGLVRHLKRTLQVDSERVFLFGFGEGGNMALEMGGSHPDLFAGIIPMGAWPSIWMIHEYARNYQQLPLYYIVGDQMGSKDKAVRLFIESVMNKGYPALTVSYKGRGPEWFGAELPEMFDWMSRKKRSIAVPELGKRGLGTSDGQEYRCMRTTDNRFYWLSTDEILDGVLLEKVRGQQFTGAQLQGVIREGNVISVKTKSVRNVTVWLGKGMVDFSLPVRIQINSLGEWNNNRKPLSPDLTVLMEDLYDRADKQRPYFYRYTAKVTP